MNQSRGGIPKEWLLLDTCSTSNVFNTCSYLGAIIACDIDDDLKMQSNGGSMTYGLKSTMKLFPLEVAYNEDSVGNIISFFRLIQVPGVVITLDSRINDGFNVTYLGKLYHFIPFENGLYYFDTRNEPRSVEDNTTKDIVSPYFLLQTVEDNKAFYTQ